MKCRPINSKGYKLLHDGALALSEVERNGIRVDVAYIEHTQKKIRKMRKALGKQLLDTKVWRHWQRMYGPNADFGADKQLREVLFSDHKHSMGYESQVFTRTGLPAVNQYNLETTRDPFAKLYI